MKIEFKHRNPFIHLTQGKKKLATCKKIQIRKISFILYLFSSCQSRHTCSLRRRIFCIHFTELFLFSVHKFQIIYLNLIFSNVDLYFIWWLSWLWMFWWLVYTHIYLILWQCACGYFYGRIKHTIGIIF